MNRVAAAPELTRIVVRSAGLLDVAQGFFVRQEPNWAVAVESMLAGDSRTGTCCHGDQPTLADICLVPQIFNAQRFNARLDHVPTVMRIHEHCLALPAFAKSVPAVQLDAE